MNWKTTCSLLLLFLCSGFSLQDDKDCQPGFEGFYYHKLNDQNSAVLRFFSNGEVIATTSSNRYQEVKNYFTLDRKDMMLHGKYKWKKCGSSFKVKGDTGEEHYSVKLRSGDLSVTVTDKSTGKSVFRIYQFYHTPN